VGFGVAMAGLMTVVARLTVPEKPLEPVAVEVKCLKILK